MSPPGPGIVPRAKTSGRVLREDSSYINVADVLVDMLADLDIIAATGGGGGGGSAAVTSQTSPLVSAQDTSNGRTSPDFQNVTSRGLLLLLDVTGQSGTGVLSTIALQTKTLSGRYIEICKFTALNISATGGKAFYAYPGAGAPGSYKGSANLPIGKTLRIVTTCATDNVGNDLTYSVDVVMLP